MIARFLVATATTWVLAGCGAPAGELPEAPFPVTFSATTDDGDPLAGVAIAVAQHALGTTAASGRLDGSLLGREGQTLSTTVSCPTGFASEGPADSLRLIRNHQVGSSTTEPISYHATCTRLLHDVVVVVRSERGADLPVEVDGKRLATTSAAGIAHVLVRIDRDVRSVTLSLDTSARPDLRPQHPSKTFELSGRDALLVFEQNFVPAPLRRVPRAVGPVRHVPYRID